MRGGKETSFVLAFMTLHCFRDDVFPQPTVLILLGLASFIIIAQNAKPINCCNAPAVALYILLIIIIWTAT